MLDIQHEKGKDGIALFRLSGQATVEHAEVLQQELMQAFRESEQVRIDCSATEDMDFFIIQLLCSAHRSSLVWKKTLAFSGVVPDTIRQSIEMVGFKRDSGCPLCPNDATCMWIRPAD